MQTVNFNCSHCGKLMAVGINLAGRNVRCPHCKQVVQAPATFVTPGSKSQAGKEAVQHTPAEPQECHESIFGEVHDDDLFGTRPPKVLMPSGITHPPFLDSKLPFNDATTQLPTAPHNSAYSSSPTGDMEPLAEYTPAGKSWKAAAAAPVPTQSLTPATDPQESEPAPLSHEKAVRSTYAPRSKPQKEASGGGPLIWILLLYSALATAGAAYLFFNQTNAGDPPPATAQPSPFFAIPDFFGQYPVADRKKIVRIDGMPDPRGEVAKELQVAMGKTIIIGDIEVKPTGIEYRVANRVNKEADKAEAVIKPTPNEIFLLHLHVKNRSEDVAFYPTDPALNSVYPKKTSVLSYTGFVFGKRTYLGGPFQWPDGQYERQFIEGQQNDVKPLGPKEERDYIIASTLDGPNIRKEIENLKDEETAIWRVQLRRGLMAYKDKEGKEHDDPMTCVIGVIIPPSAIR